MCGICGITYFDNNELVDEKELINIRDTMIHRGPDSSGLYLDRNTGLGFRRLSIIDLATGDQPIKNEDNTIVLIANGEIYNYKELKKPLLDKGHVFKTKTDVEVIIHLYEEYGDAFVTKLNGMFAFAIYDQRKKAILLARDRCGIKPLYYHKSKNGFIFASEIKSILNWRETDTGIEENIVPEYFIFRHLTNNRTFFKNIYSLEPGQLIYFKNNQIKIKTYWPDSESFESEDRSEQELFALLENSVKMQLMSDVPLGTLLSGGIDSSLVSALCAKNQNDTINTFSVGFHEEEFDETYYAKVVSKKFGTRHHQIKISDKEFAELLPTIIWHHDEPLNHANSVQIYSISKYAKNYVKVVLSGEGADELFGGYPRYFIAKWHSSFIKFPNFLRNTFIKLISLIGEKRIEKLYECFQFPLERSNIINSAFVRLKYVKGLFNDRALTFNERLADFEKARQQQNDLLNAFFRFEQKTYMLSILNRQDKMSMAASLEARVPFLDNNLIGFANSLDANRKLRFACNKYLLKKAAKNILPNEIINRPKCGFGVPINQWLRNKNGLGKYLDMTIDKIDCIPDINNKILKERILEHKNNKYDHSELLWPVINLVLWHELFISKNIDTSSFSNHN